MGDEYYASLRDDLRDVNRDTEKWLKFVSEQKSNLKKVFKNLVLILEKNMMKGVKISLNQHPMILKNVLAIYVQLCSEIFIL